MEHSISINNAQQISLFDFNDHDDQFKPTFTLFEQKIIDALEEAGSAGLTTKQLQEKHARNATAAITGLRQKGVNIISVPLGPVYDPERGCLVFNTVKFVLGSPRFISPKPAATLH